MSNNKQHLVVISGNSLHRYEGRRHVNQATIDPQVWESHTIEERKALIEDFRVNGFGDDEPGAEAIHVAQHEMQTTYPLEGMELAKLLELWNTPCDNNGYIGRYRASSVYEELTRRNIDVPRS